jgi:hypothetical protein
VSSNAKRGESLGGAIGPRSKTGQLSERLSNRKAWITDPLRVGMLYLTDRVYVFATDTSPILCAGPEYCSESAWWTEEEPDERDDVSQ